MSRRSETLVALVKEYNRVHAAWVDDDNRPAPDDIYWDACTAVTEAFGSGEVPADCRDLADAVDDLTEELAIFDQRDDINNPQPHEKFWQARQALESLFVRRERKQLPPLESIAQLKAQGVGDRQICDIYGLKDAHGRHLVHLVQAELDKPGSVLKTPGAVAGRDWVDPRLADEPTDEVGDQHFAALEAKLQSSKPAACPESPRELWEQQVSVNQSAQMLGKTPAEVAELFASFDAEREATLASGETVDATTQAIRELHAEGKTAKQIQADLKVTAQAVRKALAGQELAAA